MTEKFNPRKLTMEQFQQICDYYDNCRVCPLGGVICDYKRSIRIPDNNYPKEIYYGTAVKIEDLTLGEIQSMCMNQVCDNCPLHPHLCYGAVQPTEDMDSEETIMTLRISSFTDDDQTII